MARQYFFKSVSLCLLMVFVNACQRDQQEGERLPDRVSYNFHIRPILTDRCFSCHGPDEAARKADLRLDLGESVYNARTNEGLKILVAGKASKSMLWERINSSDAELTMPPVDSKLTLSPHEKQLIKKWIEQGALFEPHWAFQPVGKPKIPKSVKKGKLEPIDAYIQEKLDEQNLTFAEEADRITLLRRLYFDLTGIGPSPLEIATFLADKDSDVYARLVDSLLTATAFAERMATDWLDIARYADSQGMHSDGWRSMYPWRDWVIDAFKKNMPFDQFILEQLSGDLLPHPSTDQLVATGFNRNHTTTAEGGVVDEEFKKEYAHDRVATTATAFLGLTRNVQSAMIINMTRSARRTTTSFLDFLIRWMKWA
ncbi:MAG: DUF1549 domain-containing protein [Saprospiraceae bacterium]|nr:DUF1549 domain-containing protein [Saprospiraceae bacterium]